MSTLKVNAITDTTGLLAPVFPAGSAQLNPLANREDLIINGDMSIWQRGQSGTTFGYVADRWINGASGGTVTMTRQSFSPGDNLGTAGLNPIFLLRQTVSGQTLPSQSAEIQQRIEDVRSYAGQTITLLGWARRSSGATGNMAVYFAQNFGIGGSVSAGTTPVTVTLTGSWVPFAAVFTVPSIVGKTLGTDGTDYLALRIFTSGGSDLNAITNSLGLQTIGVDLWGIHIRRGTWTAAATADYTPRDPGTELALCQRYFEVGSVSDDGGIGTKYGLAGASKYNSSHPFRVTKRGGTTIAITGTPQYLNCSAIAIAIATGITGFTSRVTVTATGEYRAYDCGWTADAEL